MIPHDPTEHVDIMPGVGDLIGGRYRLESVIGHGALGRVMRAEHIAMGRQVAVKVLRPELSNHPKIRRRLIDCVHQAQQLKHPNNCRLLDFGQSDGSLFVVMELLEGVGLHTIIERGAPYPVGWVVAIGLQMLDGLGEAHELGLVHRNLKPRNIILLPRRRGGQQVKVLDYALASSLDVAAQDNEGEAEICGTAAYLAPETLIKQESGKPTDVYAIGLILIEMLTGRRVFHGQSLAQVLYRQIHTSVTLPPKLAWTAVGKVLLEAVSKHPNNRFADADAFYEALEEAAESTASYFRLDATDLKPDPDSMPPELLARMVRSQNRGRPTVRDGAPPESSTSNEDAATPSGNSDADPTPSALPPIPPPFTPPPEARGDFAHRDRRSFGRAEPARPDASLDDDATDPERPSLRLSHPLKDAAADNPISPSVGASAASDASAPAGEDDASRSPRPEPDASSGTVRPRPTTGRVNDFEAVSVWWRRPAAIAVAAALILLLASAGIYLIFG